MCYRVLLSGREGNEFFYNINVKNSLFSEFFFVWLLFHYIYP
jgi:hypothetical protein